MLQPRLCACGCLQPFIGGDEWRDGMLRNHGEASRIPNTPSYLVEDRGYKTPCWVWQGVLNKWGYAKLKRNTRTIAGHRLFYLAYTGSLPEGPASGPFRMQLDHLCRVRKCVNPEHLEPATCVENIKRWLVPSLDIAGVHEAVRLYAEGHSQAKVASMIGVQQGSVSRILRGVRWKELGINATIRNNSPKKLVAKDVLGILARLKAGEGQTDIARSLNLSPSHINAIALGKKWRSIHAEI